MITKVISVALPLSMLGSGTVKVLAVDRWRVERRERCNRLFILPVGTFLQVSNVLAALQSGAKGTQACINAASTVSGIIGDLDTTIMFATAGTLNADPDESFNDHRWCIAIQTLHSL